MPAKSPEALERKRQRMRQRRAEKRAAAIDALQRPINKTSAEYRRRLPEMPSMSPAEARAFLAQAIRNTAGASA